MVKKYDAFKSILRLEQADLKDFCKKMLEYYDYDIEDGDGYLFGKGDIPIMVLAHLDTVHKLKPSEIYFDQEQGVMWSPQGIGGDDRCGVYMVLKLLQHVKPYVMFLEDEEIGGVGAEKMILKVKKPNINFMIELDRRGQDDCVFYDCGNKDFQDYIQKFGFQKKYGTFTDISVISPEWDVASVNLSVGYNREHTIEETINVNYLHETFEKVLKILKDTNTKAYDFQEIQRVYDSYTNYEDYEEIDGVFKYKYNKDKKDKKEIKKYHAGNKYNNDGYWDDDGVFVPWFDEYE